MLSQTAVEAYWDELEKVASTGVAAGLGLGARGTRVARSIRVRAALIAMCGASKKAEWDADERRQTQMLKAGFGSPRVPVTTFRR